MQNDEAVRRAARTLREGGLVALPTETVYGLAADASNELAVRRIFAVKGRPSTHPLIVHLESAEALPRWAREIPPAAQQLADAFWPGPLTLILKKTALASDVVTGEQDTVGLRVPDHPLAQAVLRELGGGVAAPSANRFGRVSPTRAEHVHADLGEDVDLILDGGPCAVGVESTIIDLSGSTPALLRPGGTPIEHIERVLGCPVPLMEKGDVRAPGTLASHYAPRAGLELCTPAELLVRAESRAREGKRVALLAPSGEGVPSLPGVTPYPVPPDDGGFARALYGLLREADAAGHDVILAAAPEAHGLGLAVLDRLRRAAAPRPG